MDILAEYISVADLAAQLDVSPRTLERWHRLGDGPARIKVGQRVLYSREAVSKWLRDHEVVSDARAAS